MDYGHDETEKILKKTEKQLDKVYSQAYKELKQKSDDYWSFFSTTDKLKRQQLANGEITTAEYQQWRLSHCSLPLWAHLSGEHSAGSPALHGRSH